MVDREGVFNALRDYGTFFDNFRVADLDTLWEHEFSDLPESAGVGITSKFFDWNGATRVGPDVEINEGEDIRTKETGIYGAGKIAIPGCAGRLKSSITGDQEFRMGYFGSGDGVLVGEDSTGKFVENQASTSSDRVYQENWNRNKLDGTNGNGPDLDFTDGVIVRFPHACYGHGKVPVVIGVKLDSNDTGGSWDDGDFKLFLVHEFSSKGQTMWDRFDHPVRWEFDGTQGDDNGLLATACHYQGETGRGIKRTNGQTFNPEVHNGGSNITLAAAPDWTYIMSYRKRSTDWEDVNINPQVLSINADNRIEVQLTVRGSFDNTSFGLPEDTSEEEVAVEYDLKTWDLSTDSAKGTDTTVASIGEREWVDVVAGDKQQPVTVGAELENVVLTGQDTLALLARPATGLSTDVRYATLRNGSGF